MKLMYDLDNPATPLYAPLRGIISGFRNFCSGAVMSSMSGPYKGTVATAMSNPLTKPFHKVDTLEEYEGYYGCGGCYALPEEIAYLCFLEKLYLKAALGLNGDNQDHGDYPLWAGDDWATKTWFIADRMTGRGYPDESLSCSKLMKFMSRPECAGTYGQMMLSPLADGAHGGQCSGGVWAPNLAYLEERIEWAIQQVNDHAYVLSTQYKKVAPPADELAAMY